MSHVTDVILTVSLMEEDDVSKRFPSVEEINSWLSAGDFGVLKKVDDFAGGRKAIQAAVFMGAFNYLDIGQFLAIVSGAKWEDFDGMALFIKDENDNRFTDMTPVKS